jgi:hypothetical protein
MAKSDDEKINAWRKLRRFYLRRRDRARKRRANAKSAADKASALRVIRRNRGKANVLLRKIRHRRKVVGKSGVSWYDGRKCATWLVPYLQWARSHGWDGVLTSGYRDPAYSESLCYAMCGAPACPGRCAGRASNHSGSEKPHGAIDVSDYYSFGDLMKRCPYSPRIFNGLGSRDPVHFSASGN